jgi:arylsulfatase A-like enzyme
MRRFQKTAEKIHNGEFDIYKLRMISTKPEVRFSYMAGEFEISEEEWNLIKSWYDAEILYLDYHIGDLVNFLMHEGLFDDTLLIITADHGENLGEHGLADHHFSLYDNLLRVPLIMVYPNCIPSNTKVSSIVSSIDIFPTILDITRIKNSLRIQGVSLSSFEDRKIHDFICAERGSSLTSIDVSHLKKSFSPFRDKLRYIDKGAKCIRDENYKYILYEDGREELYNIYEDTNEQNNIIDEERKVADMMKEKLKRGLDLSYWGPRKNYWPKKSVIERLKSLGYI